MPNPLSWILELVDKMSGPAGHATKSLEKMEKATHHTSGALEELEKANKRAMGGVVESVLEAVTVVELFRGSVDLVKEAMEAADFERSTGIAFKTLAGNVELGERALAGAKAFAQEANVPLREAVSLYQTLLMGGVKGDRNLAVLSQAATDIQKLSGGRRSAESIAEAFGDINSQGVLMSRQLMQFKGVLDFGILSKRLTGHAGDLKSLTRELEDSPVKANRAIKAIMETLAAQEGGALGKVTKDIGEGWDGALNHLKNSWELMMGNFEKSPAFEKLIQLALNVSKVFEDPNFTKAVNGFAEAMVTAAAALDRIVPSAKTLYNLFGGGLGEAAAKKVDEVRGAVGPLGTSKVVGRDLGRAGVWALRHNPMFMPFIKGWEWAYDATGGERRSVRGSLGNDLPVGTSSLAPATMAKLGLTISPGGHTVTVHQTFNTTTQGPVDEKELAKHLHDQSMGGLQSVFDQIGLSTGGI